MQIIKQLFYIFIICVMPYGCFGFDVSELVTYQGVVVKTMVESDTLHKKTSKKTEIRNGEALRKILGDEKIKFKTQYIYIGKKEITNLGETTWYNYTPKSSNKKVYHLYYQKNDVMHKGNIGDTLVVAKKNDDEIALVIIEKDNPAVAQVYEMLGVNKIISKPVQKKSFWARLFEKHTEPDDDDEYDDDAFSTPDPKDIDWARIDLDIYKNNQTGQIFFEGYPTRIIDGDTIVLADVIKVRMEGIDTPESRQNCLDSRGKEYACGKEATKHLTKLLGNSKLRCEMNGFGDYGRFLMICRKLDGLDIHAQMVHDGYAVVSTYTPDMYLAEEKYAIEHNLGIHKGKFQHPHCWRHRKKQIWKVPGLCENGKYYTGWENIGVK